MPCCIILRVEYVRVGLMSNWDLALSNHGLHGLRADKVAVGLS